MRAFIILMLFLPIPLMAELNGDVEAIRMARQVIESIGGHDVWRKARSMYVVENSRSPEGDGIIAEFHRDLTMPRERYSLYHRDGNRSEFWWDERGVSRLVNGKPDKSDLPDDIHALVLDYWRGEIYVMLRRLASEDPKLRLQAIDDRSFTAFEGKRRLGRFWVNAQGELYRWRHDDGTEYIYGPLKKFGNINFPDWGTQVDGSWSFYYTEVRLSDAPPEADFTPHRP